MCYNESITLIHTTADGPNDSIHHIWDFTGPPSILIALTEPNASVTIDWGSFMDDAIDAIQISPTPIYSAALVLTKVSLFFLYFYELARVCVCGLIAVEEGRIREQAYVCDMLTNSESLTL